MNSSDLYLGSFLILSGFALSLLNIRRLVKEVNSSFPAVLISENILLMCIGIAFISRSLFEMNPTNTEMQDIEERFANMGGKDEMDCNFYSVLKSYGPLIVSLVNSFLSLVIDNYMHYRMLADVKKEDEENTVQDFNQTFRDGISNASKLKTFAKKYFSYIAVALQWIVPIMIALSMYPIRVREQYLSMDEVSSSSDFCLAMVDATNETCLTNFANYSLELGKFLPPEYLIEAHETLLRNESTANEINSVINNVYQIIANMTNTTFTNVNVTSPSLRRKAKANQSCMKVCYMDSKNLILYMFFVAVISYFIPITISTVILTKIHIMDVKRPGTKTYVSRELLYNILFWTPVMFDTFLSLLLCSYSMNGIRTSIFNVIANIYQAVKNFMNTKYFQDNSINPI